MAEADERLEDYREACERSRLARARGACEALAYVERLAEVDDRFADVTAGEWLGGLRAERETARFAEPREELARLVYASERAGVDAAGRALDREIAARSADDPAETRALREEAFVLRGERLAKLGHPNRLGWQAARFESVDVDAWSRAAHAILEHTQAAFRDGASLRRESYPELFPAARLRACLDHLLEGWRVRVEPEADASLPGACVAPRIPAQVHVLHASRDAVEVYEAAFDAAGRALALRFTSPDLPYARRALGDPAPSRAWGRLLADRLCDRDWIAGGPAAPRADVFPAQERHVRLSRVRRAAALLEVELALARLPAGEDPRPIGDLYADILSETTGTGVPAARCLAEADPDLGSLHDLRAACLAAQLEESLRGRHGVRFQQSRAAGELLKEVWATGTTYPAESLAEQLDLGPLSPEFLIETLLAVR